LMIQPEFTLKLLLFTTTTVTQILTLNNKHQQSGLTTAQDLLFQVAILGTHLQVLTF
jgi:hypothetical protein